MNLKSVILPAMFAACSLTMISSCKQSGGSKSADKKAGDTTTKAKGEEADTLSVVKSSYPPVDKAKYDELLKFNAHTDTSGRWPVKNQPYPVGGAILPFKRVVSFYGNLYSKKMGILGELPPNEMLAKLKGEVKAWEKADPKTPVQPLSLIHI